jgi:hypothetical protein
VAQTRKRLSHLIGRPKGHPLLYRLEINGDIHITKTESGNSTLLDVTVPTDTEGVKMHLTKKTGKIKEGLDDDQLIRYGENLKVFMIILIVLANAYLIYELISYITGD